MKNLIFTLVGSKRLVINGIARLNALAGIALAAVSGCAWPFISSPWIK